jgi:hypothetical protein
MKRTPVQSSNLKNVGFDPRTKTLEIGFRSGRVYRYTGVSAQRHKALMAAPSKGKYHWKAIRNNLPYVRVK